MLLVNADRLVTNLICVDFRYLCQSCFLYLWADLKTPRAPKIQLKWTKIKYTTFDKELSHFILIKIMIHSCQAQKYLMPKTTNICQLTIKINLPLSHGQIQENRISFLIFSPRLQLKLTFASTQQMEK